MIRALAPGDRIKLIACGDEAVESARAATGDVAEIVPALFGDIWLRDTGPVFARAGGEVIALRFDNNGWGGKYPLKHDDRIGDDVATAAGRRIQRHPFVLEGGAIEHNGAGWVLTTRQCLLNPNRNSGWNEAVAEAKLKASLGCERVLWLDKGLCNDHTDGHIDNLARFISPDTVVCQHASGDDDPNRKLYAETREALAAMGLTVHEIPSPGKVLDADGNVVPASHMNFIIGNDKVVVPVYGTATADAAVTKLSSLFPDRAVTGVTSNALLSGGGSFHCITQQEPV